MTWGSLARRGAEGGNHRAPPSSPSLQPLQPRRGGWEALGPLPRVCKFLDSLLFRMKHDWGRLLPSLQHLPSVPALDVWVGEATRGVLAFPAQWRRGEKAGREMQLSPRNFWFSRGLRSDALWCTVVRREPRRNHPTGAAPGPQIPLSEPGSFSRLVLSTRGLLARFGLFIWWLIGLPPFSGL